MQGKPFTPEVAKILETEFNEDFVEGMRQRMVMSFYKYGYVRDAYGVGGKVNAITSATDRMRKYAETKNTEYLIDAANFMMIEFMCPSLEGAHFTPTDDDGSPGRRTARSGVPDKRDNASIGTNPNSKTAPFRGE